LLVAMLNPVAAQTWTELTPEGGPSGPILKGYKDIGYDPATNRLILYFPSNPNVWTRPLPEVWVLTHANGLGGLPEWIQLTPEGSLPTNINFGAGTVYDATTNRLIVYGGCFSNCSPAQSSVYVLTHANGLGGTPTWTESPVTNPQARVLHSVVFDPTTNRLIAFAGQFAFPGTSQNDTRILSNANDAARSSTWQTLSIPGAVPGRREYHTAAYDGASNRMMIFGGMNNQSSLSETNLNDVWILTNANSEGGTPQWTPLSPDGALPDGRAYHSTVYDSIHNRMILFGGMIIQRSGESKVLGDLWALSHANGLGGSPTWTQLPQSGTLPGANQGHQAVFDAAHQRMIVFGGSSRSGHVHKPVWVLVL